MKQEETTSARSRAEFAVAWRDRYIKELGDALVGREEEVRLLAAFLEYLLAEKIKEASTDYTLDIAKADIAAVLGRVSIQVSDTEAAYRLTLGWRQESQDNPNGDHVGE